MSLPLPTAAAFDGSEVPREAYRFLADLVYQRTRIQLGPAKQALVAARLARRRHELGFESWEQYCDLFCRPGHDEELERLIDLISTHHTQFFREAAHFKFLCEKFIPEWKRGNGSDKALRIWSAACSSGEEPYSIAMALAEQQRAASLQLAVRGESDLPVANRQHAAWTIDASDISRQMLRAARQGIYAAETVKLPSPKLLPRCFQKGVGDFAGQYRVKDVIHEKVAFRHLNLFQPAYPFTEGFAVIFCRNVMIYFDRKSQEELVQKLTRQLAPGGCLIVGHSESLLGIKHPLRYAQPSIYQRADSPE